MAGWLMPVGSADVAHVAALGLLHSKDEQIFFAAREAGAIVVTKDEDFVRLLERHGPPPHLVWITCGNVRNARLREIMESFWPVAFDLIEGGEPLVEIGRWAG
jgi:predicted nuclease of predicted toxin-antitoxin system